ncbi:MAG: hypothetical protein JSS97_05235 [Actinobacteria bacterium]|nr:hypothetical protein [Actinomycetota bacterium]
MSEGRGGGGTGPVIELGPARHLEKSRADGYWPITDRLWVRAKILGAPSDEAWRLFWSAARRLDSGHRQIERIRQAIDELPPIESPLGRQAMQEVMGDAEMAIWAIDKALDITLRVQRSYRIPGSFPKIVLEKRPLVEALRDHYSHIDHRALGKVRERIDPSSEDAFHFDSLFYSREFTDGKASLGIDQEATELCIATRDYLVAAWSRLTAGASEGER